MAEAINQLFDSTLSVALSTGSFLRFIAIACAGAVILGLLGRLIFGRRSGVNHAISAALGILALYLLGVALYCFGPRSDGLLSALPFAAVRDGALAVYPLLDLDFSLLCSQLLRMVVLAFVMNLLDLWIPRGKNILTWLLLRCVTLVLAILLQGGVVWLVNTYLPGAFQTWAPVILSVLLAAALLLGALKAVLGLALAVVNPVIAGLYTFFFANKIGKQLTKAILTTLLLSILSIVVCQMGYGVIALAGIRLEVLLPVVLVLLLLWYVVGALL